MFTLILQLLVWWCVLFMLPPSQASGSQCFLPDGALAVKNHPCEPSQSESFCCGVGWICAIDKVCYPTSALGDNWLNFTPSRGTCTDVSWNSGECPSYCLSNLDLLDNGQSFYKCPGSNPPSYCCHKQDCNCADGGDFKLPSVAQISLIIEPPKSSVVLPPVTLKFTMTKSQTIINNLVSVVRTSAPTPLYSAVLINAAATPTSLVSVTFTNTPLPSTTSEQSTSSSQAQSTSSQSPGVNQASAASAAPAQSRAKKSGVDFVVPVVALAIAALVLFVFRS